MVLTLQDTDIATEWDSEPFLLVMGEYANACIDFSTPFRLVESWTVYQEDAVIVLETVDPRSAGVVGSFEIQVNPAVAKVQL